MVIKICPLCHKRYAEYDFNKYPPCDECKKKFPKIYGTRKIGEKK